MVRLEWVMMMNCDWSRNSCTIRFEALVVGFVEGGVPLSSRMQKRAGLALEDRKEERDAGHGFFSPPDELADG